jgi:uncharacterized membrane protein HdeD (DUF308 family)
MSKRIGYVVVIVGLVAALIGFVMFFNISTNAFAPPLMVFGILAAFGGVLLYRRGARS